MAKPQFIWDVSPAYDLFVSLEVLHDPERYGLRGNWAAGVRSRLPAHHREFLHEVAERHHLWPLPWLASLDMPKDSAAVLEHLEETPPARRLPEMAACYIGGTVKEILYSVAEQGAWTERDKQALHKLYAEENRKAGKGKKKVTVEDVESTLEVWANVEQFGQDYLEALQSYYDVFFHEEESRILPALEQSAAKAKTLADALPLDELLTSLSQGLRFDYEGVEQMQELVMIPSFWTTPLTFFGPVRKEQPQKWIFLFGGRPDDVSLVPGEVVPELLYNTLKALADPTRLRILKYLADEPTTPAELARRLRLRPPTVIHHLDALRLARLVHVTLSYQGRRYEARREAVNAACAMLNRFLLGQSSE